MATVMVTAMVITMTNKKKLIKWNLFELLFPM